MKTSEEVLEILGGTVSDSDGSDSDSDDETDDKGMDGGDGSNSDDETDDKGMDGGDGSSSEDEAFEAITSNPLQVAEIEAQIRAKEMVGDDMGEEVDAEIAIGQIANSSYETEVQELLRELDRNKHIYFLICVYIVKLCE